MMKDSKIYEEVFRILKHTPGIDVVSDYHLRMATDEIELLARHRMLEYRGVDNYRTAQHIVNGMTADELQGVLERRVDVIELELEQLQKLRDAGEAAGDKS